MLAAIALPAAVAPAAQAAWGKPFEFTKPGSLDYTPPQVAFSPHGAAAATFSIRDVDSPGSGRSYVVARSANGKVGRPRQVDGARRILSEAYDGRALELLVGASPAGLDCCSTAEAIRVSPRGRIGRARKLVGGLAGQTLGRLQTLGDQRMLAVVATERGVWVSQSRGGDRFGDQHRISARHTEPVSMDAAWLGGDHTTVAWTAGRGVIGEIAPRAIFVSSGTRTSGPQRQHTAVTVPKGHRIDELAIARRGSAATLAWIEGWYDRKGAYHARVEASDIGAHGGRSRTRALSPANRLASGLSFAADAGGDQAVAWQSCTVGGSCTAQAVGRPAGGGFASAKTLGASDAPESPALAIAPSGRVVVAWVRGGHPVASVGFGKPTVLSRTTYASGIDVAYGPRHAALAAWSQGTLNPSIVGAAYRGR